MLVISFNRKANWAAAFREILEDEAEDIEFELISTTLNQNNGHCNQQGDNLPQLQELEPLHGEHD